MSPSAPYLPFAPVLREEGSGVEGPMLTQTHIPTHHSTAL